MGAVSVKWHLSAHHLSSSSLLAVQQGGHQQHPTARQTPNPPGAVKSSPWFMFLGLAGNHTTSRGVQGGVKPAGVSLLPSTTDDGPSGLL